MSEQRPYKRKLLNFSINREMQLKMIGKIFLILFVSLLISGLIFYQFANQEITSSFKMFHIKAQSFLDFLLPVVLISFCVSLVAGVIGSLFFPKNYAGSLYRIEADLKKVTEDADLSVEIKLRGSDQNLPLATQVNALLADLRQRIGASQQALQLLDQLCEHSDSSDQQALRRVRDELRNQIGELKV